MGELRKRVKDLESWAVDKSERDRLSALSDDELIAEYERLRLVVLQDMTEAQLTAHWRRRGLLPL